MTRHRAIPPIVTAWCSLLCLVVVAAGARAQDALAPAWTRITYISGSTIYLEVGSKQGLAEQGTLDVVRGGAMIARLRVTAVSSGRAACEVLPPVVELVVGDSVRYVAPSAAGSTAPVTVRTSASSARRAGSLRGRIGLRYLVVAPDGDAGGGLTQPAYDLRLDGQRLGGSGVGLTVDARAQRTQYAAAGTQAARPTLNSTRVYLAALSWDAGNSGWRLTAGRQLAGALASVGLFDGVALDLARRRWGVGAFAGSQPDAQSFGVSARVREYGAYGELHSAAGARTTGTLALGGIGSYVGATIDREYAFGRLTLTGPMLSLYATQELDFNRGWKRDAEQRAMTPTASFASVQFTPTRALAISGGIDNRRSVRLYRDYVNPELAFDDAFRAGTWAGVTVSAPRYARLSVDRRDSRGGTSGSANSSTFMGSVSGLSRLRLGLRVRATSFDGALSSGQLVSGAVDIDPWGVLRLEANGGTRTTRQSGSAAGALKLTWWGVDADIGIGRSLYVMLSTYREQEPGRASMQTYAALSWRF